MTTHTIKDGKIVAVTKVVKAAKVAADKEAQAVTDYVTPLATDLATRAIHTFWQTFVVVFVGSESTVTDFSTLKSLAGAAVLAAAAATLSMAKSYVKTQIAAYKANKELKSNG